VAVGATAAEEVLAPSATSVARLAILLVRALKLPLEEEEEEATARSVVVVVDLKRPGGFFFPRLFVCLRWGRLKKGWLMVFSFVVL